MSLLIEPAFRSESPAKPKDDAAEPEEATVEQNAAVSVETQSPAADGEAGKTTKMAAEALTEAMIKEEEKLHEQTVELEEQELKQQTKELDVEEEIHQQRFQRLQFLLNKSKLYTNYLIERMERQKASDAKKQERIEKKMAQQKDKPDTEEEKEKVEEEVRKSGRLGGASERRLSSRRSQNNSQASQDDSQDSVKSQRNETTNQGTPKRGRKRKSDCKISDYFDGKNAKSKKQKLDEEGAAVVTEPVPNESQTSDDEPGVSGPRYFKGELLDELQPELLTGGCLRQYQIEGFSWLRSLYENGVNGILADEMGLGKTIQCIASVAHLVKMKVPGPFLIVVPLSTLPNWVAEFKKFTPNIPVVLYHGSKDDRARLRNKINRKHVVEKGVEIQPVVVTSYEIAMNDRKSIMNHEWKYLIVDEGHRIKNAQCRLIKELKMYKSTHRLLLTGTPLQNNLSELWSLLNFLLPEIFDDLGSFEAWFSIQHLQDEGAAEQIVAEEQKQNVLSMLHQILAPFMLRRQKCDVDLCIPPKKEILVYAPLTKEQQDYYKHIVDRTIMDKIDEKRFQQKVEEVELDKKGRPIRKGVKKVNYELMIGDDKEDDEEDEEDLENWVQAVSEANTLNSRSVAKEPALYDSVVTINLKNVMMQLRKCCNHPYLLEYPVHPGTQEYLVDEQVIRSCGKMLMLDRMMPELKKNGHKVLIFSQMTKMMDILEDYCHLKSYNYCRLDGSTKIEDRQEQMAKFNGDDDMFVFLLSTRAGGLGINLVAADTVIIYDSDWNPQCDLQAQDRCHRIGQVRPVVVYRMVTANTIDQKIVERASAKRRLEKMVIHQGKFKQGMHGVEERLVPLNPQELLELLKSHDHSSVVDVKDGSVISNRDLRLLLDRNDLHQIWKNKKEQSEKTKSLPSPKQSKAASQAKHVQDVKGVFKTIEEATVKGALS